MNETDISSIERNFVLNSIKNGLRTDLRAFDESRKIKLQMGPNAGQAQAQLGKTRVITNVTCEIVRPSINNPTEGSITFNTDFSPLASPLLDSEKTAEIQVNLSRMLEKAFRKSRAVDTEGLCIIAGEKVWAIKVDIKVINNEGNILDCACIAANAALLDFKRPDVTVKGVDVIIVIFAFMLALNRRKKPDSSKYSPHPNLPKFWFL
jgi:exosome complex component RRP45